MCHCVLFIQHPITLVTCDIITAIDDGAAAADVVIQIILILLSDNCSCYRIMTSHFNMSVKTKDIYPTSNLLSYILGYSLEK